MNLTSIDINKMENSIKIANNCLSDDESIIELEYVLHKRRWNFEKFMRLCNALIRSNFKMINIQNLKISMNSNLDSNLRYMLNIDTIKNINTKLNSLKKKNLFTIKSIFTDILKDNKRKIFSKQVIPEGNLSNVIYHYYGRVSKETQLNKLPDELLKLSNDEFMCLGRQMNRKKFIIEKNDTYQISIDCSEINNLISIYDINQSDAIYDVELDIEIYKNVDVLLLNNKILKIIQFVLQVYDNNEHIMSLNDVKFYKSKFKELMSYQNLSYFQNTKTLIGNKINLIHNSLHNYSTTFAFGNNRSYLVLCNNSFIYNSNNEMYKINLKVPEEFYDTVLYGEYINVNFNKRIFWAEDIIIYQGQCLLIKSDLTKSVPQFNVREKCLKTVITNVFGFDENDNIFYKEHHTSIKTQVMFQESVKEKFEMYCNRVTSIMGTHSVIPKFYIPNISFYNNANKVIDNNIWKIIEIILNVKQNINFTGFTITSVSQFKDHDGIPPSITWINEKDSILCNFYVELGEKSENEETIDAILYCNKTEFKNNKKVPYLENLEVYKANIPIIEDFPRCINGEIIKNRSIVCFEMSINTKQKNTLNKWKPLYVLTSNLKYFGDNYQYLNSLLNYNSNVLYQSKIMKLANCNSNSDYWSIIKTIKESSVSKSQLNGSFRIAELFKYSTFRKARHYLLPFQTNSKISRKKVLEINFDNGFLFPVYYNAMVNKITAIDTNEKKLIIANSIIGRLQVDSKSLISPLFNIRCNIFKRNKYPVLNTCLADISLPLVYKEQIKNKSIKDYISNDINKFFKKSNTYDIVTSFFGFSKVLKTSETFDNFMLNINNLISSDGILLIIDYNGEYIDKLFKKYGDTIEIKNKDKVVLKIKKEYNQEYKNLTIGSQIFVENCFILNNSTTTNIFNKSWIDSILLKMCNLICIDTISYFDMYNQYLSEYNAMKDCNINLHKTFNFDIIKNVLNSKLDENEIDILNCFQLYVYQKTDINLDKNKDVIVI